MPPVVETRGLTKAYGATRALIDLDLRVEAGEVLGLLGPNGAGKTTTLRLLLDLTRPTAGTARLFGEPVGDPLLRARLGYLPGDLAMDVRLAGRRWLDLMDDLRLRHQAPADRARRARLGEQLSLQERDLDRPLRELSRGTRQKVGLVAAFQHDPELLILDEPTEGLDPLVREAFFDLLADSRARGRTIVHSSHVLSEVDRSCTRVAVLREGRLVTVEDVDVLRRGLSRKMVVQLPDGHQGDDLEGAGATILERDGGRVVLTVSGPLPPLLAALARLGATDLVFPEPDLDDAFHDLYANGSPASVTADAPETGDATPATGALPPEAPR